MRNKIHSQSKKLNLFGKGHGRQKKAGRMRGHDIHNGGEYLSEGAQKKKKKWSQKKKLSFAQMGGHMLS